MIGKTLNHYTIESRLGKGGMGEVFVAQDTSLSRKVALKILPQDMASDADRRARFEREAKAIAALNHLAKEKSPDRVSRSRLSLFVSPLD